MANHYNGGRLSLDSGLVITSLSSDAYSHDGGSAGLAPAFVRRNSRDRYRDCFRGGGIIVERRK